MKKEVNRKKNKRFYINGFTLVELLATIVVLAIICGIVIYVTINVINDTKDKSYKVIINNIENVAMEYAIENKNNIVWNYNNIDDSEQYYCVNIQKLIDTGYFKEDILDSYIDKDVLVNSNDYIYLEMDSNTMVVTKNILLSTNNDSNYNNLCSNVNTGG